ncbi:MAG: hypothetical protein KUG81_10415 [Gammaproteobacteria bacterium]|nr:hypothetical protein [Gammaproteobacteria bacterium]
MSRGSGFTGGHSETKGLSPTGEVVSVPPHEHSVELDFVRYELVTDYRVSEGLAARLRVPYDVKRRTAEIDVPEGATAAEVEAMKRNLNLHHATQTLEGFSDLSLLVVKETSDVFRAGDSASISLGSSIPVGQTEEDPFTTGASGLAHEHIQFGSGTFDPLFELHYFSPVSARVDASANVIARFPVYESDKHYKGPVEVSSGLIVSIAAQQNLSLRTGWSFFYQDYAHWNGDRDENSGLISNGLVLGASYTLTDGVRLNLDARLPISQRTLSDSGDTFEQGTVAQFGISYSF